MNLKVTFYNASSSFSELLLWLKENDFNWSSFYEDIFSYVFIIPNVSEKQLTLLILKWNDCIVEYNKIPDWEFNMQNNNNDSPCPFGCILEFNEKTQKYRLCGDCRIPWSSECYMNIENEKKYKNDSNFEQKNS